MAYNTPTSDRLFSYQSVMTDCTDKHRLAGVFILYIINIMYLYGRSVAELQGVVIDLRRKPLPYLTKTNGRSTSQNKIYFFSQMSDEIGKYNKTFRHSVRIRRVA